MSPSSSCSAAEGLLGGVEHVEEAVVVALLLVDLGDGRGHGHHAVLVDQQEEGLGGVQLQAAPGGRSKRGRQGDPAQPQPVACLPDDLDQLAHVHVVRNQELGLVQDRQLLLALIALNDDLQTGSETQLSRALV